MATRKELVRAIRERYRGATRKQRRSILDEFVAVTGCHRKHAIRVLSGGETVTDPRPPRTRIYGEAVRETLVVLWEASDRICGKRLKPLVPILVDALERHGHLKLDAEVRTQLLTASAATIDRVLSPTRAAAGRRARRGVSSTPLRRSVPVRTFGDWKEPPPGYLEIDLVAHCGESAAGSFVHTFTLTDIASGWTECVPLAVREATLVVEAVSKLRAELPFKLLGLDSDNGSEFLNETMIAWCKDNGVEYTRSRPYHKNDQAWVEQKNGAIVRRLVGYHRFEGLVATATLSRLYSVARLFQNFFQPSFQLASKTRIGARVIKKYHPAETPCARLLRMNIVPDEVKERLRSAAARLDPLRLLDEIRALQEHLAKLSAGEASRVCASSDAGLARFLDSLSTAWKSGEVRPTHCQPEKARHWWRTRKDPFEAVWPKVVCWLEVEPDRTSKELFQRLQHEQPGLFPDGQLRTLQRRVKEWRRAEAHRLIFPTSPATPKAAGDGHSMVPVGEPDRWCLPVSRAPTIAQDAPRELNVQQVRAQLVASALQPEVPVLNAWALDAS